MGKLNALLLISIVPARIVPCTQTHKPTSWSYAIMYNIMYLSPYYVYLIVLPLVSRMAESFSDLDLDIAECLNCPDLDVSFDTHTGSGCNPIL